MQGAVVTPRAAAASASRECCGDDGAGLAGTIGSFTLQGDREVTYWIDPSRWVEGLRPRLSARSYDSR